MYTFRLVRLYVLATLQNYLTRGIKAQLPLLADLYEYPVRHELRQLEYRRIREFGEEAGVDFGFDAITKRFYAAVVERPEIAESGEPRVV